VLKQHKTVNQLVKVPVDQLEMAGACLGWRSKFMMAIRPISDPRRDIFRKIFFQVVCGFVDD
jgi:hypothetical protein